MSLRVLAWNVNHRARAKAIPPMLVDAIDSLRPDLIVLTEYVHGATRSPFLDQLADRGLPHWHVSHVTPLKENHVLIASRTSIEAGSIHAPAIAPSVPSNFLHVSLPHEGCEILGLRVPDYSKQPKMQRACWEWIIETAKTVKDRPFVLIGDFNLDPRYTQTVCGDCIGKMIEDGWQLASPKEGASYWTLKDKVPCQIDHALVSGHFTILDSRYVSDFGELGSIGVTKDALSDHAILRIDIERKASRTITSVANELSD